MKERLKLSLGGLWLFTSLFALIMPVFIPTDANPQSFVQNVIGTATITMFILSFPGSLLGIPLLFFAQRALGVDPNSIGGMYFNLVVLFVLGMVQWFVVVPRIWRSDAELQMPALPGKPELQLPESKLSSEFEFFDARSRTPVERVLSDDDPD